VVDKIGPTGPTGVQGDAGVPVLTQYTPVFAGTGTTFTGDPASGEYLEYGDSVSFALSINFAEFSNFGTGQYSITLPELPSTSTGTDYSFNGILDVNGTNRYEIVGYSQGGGAVLDLFYKGVNGILTPLTGAAPATLTTASIISITGTYISEQA
jgi:hypothetical protein